jgi:hypothetical protein
MLARARLDQGEQQCHRGTGKKEGSHVLADCRSFIHHHVHYSGTSQKVRLRKVSNVRRNAARLLQVGSPV